jgi:hypothetical protein
VDQLRCTGARVMDLFLPGDLITSYSLKSMTTMPTMRAEQRVSNQWVTALRPRFIALVISYDARAMEVFVFAEGHYGWINTVALDVISRP